VAESGRRFDVLDFGEQRRDVAEREPAQEVRTVGDWLMRRAGIAEVEHSLIAQGFVPQTIDAGRVLGLTRK